ncbi:unnamed protein product [Microthlaspi erraticum]|uniref:Reverse transcriptase domain-containing protein n=1 Tax=Microthlaspi erraticum TaxID=1685480 RepID=A0A6D2IVF6_9BRAS|nr:unnamed protein product [Microthlaspi erraticum]
MLLIGPDKAPGHDGFSGVFYRHFWDDIGVIISDNQADFVPGRQITDNVMIAHELMHGLKSKRDCAENYMAIKTDISKAYDRVEWNFLEEVMKKMGLSETWTQWIMACVRSVTFSIIINGSDYAEARREFQGMTLSQHCPSVSHLLFADDSLFFCKATTQDSMRMAQILKDYEELSGGGGKYLGLPEQFGQSKTEAFQSIVDGVKKTVGGWYNQFLTAAAWRLLINPSSLLARLYKGRYHRSSTFLESVGGRNPSYGWKSIQAGKSLLKKGLQVRLGDGEDTSVWDDNWLPVLPPRVVQQQGYRREMKVKDLWKPVIREWDEDKLAALLDVEDARHAKTI